MDGRNTTFLLGNPIFGCYVSFREGKVSRSIGVSEKRWTTWVEGSLLIWVEKTGPFLHAWIPALKQKNISQPCLDIQKVILKVSLKEKNKGRLQGCLHPMPDWIVGRWFGKSWWSCLWRKESTPKKITQESPPWNFRYKMKVAKPPPNISRHWIFRGRQPVWIPNLIRSSLSKTFGNPKVSFHLNPEKILEVKNSFSSF